jgi:CBS domain containing-hemolysin-like protein
MFLGFMTLDPLDLRIKIRASVDTEERENAAQLLPLVEDHHRLLVTLLLADAVFYETMPLFLDNLFPSWAAILISVTVLLVVGEIIPSAIFTGPEQLRLAGRLTPLMTFFLKFFYPIAYPLIWLLDSLVPPEDPEEEAYNRGELSALVRIQYEEREEARRAVNFTGLVPSAGKAPYRQPRPNDKRVSTVGPLRGKNNILTVTDKSRGWRNLKREIMEAVEQRYVDSQDHTNQSRDGSSTGSPLHPNYQSSSSMHHFQDWGHRRHHHHHPGASTGSDHDSVHSISTPPAYEQIAPPLHQAEVKMVEGALTMKTKCAWDVYTPLRRIFSVPSDMILDKNTIAEIYSEGYSRVPVYERLPPPNEHRQYAMRGVLMTRQLIMIDWEDERPVSSLPIYFPPCISPRMNLVDVLQLLQKGGSHIAFVCAGPDLANDALEEERAIPIESGFMGLVTLEDVLEAILQDKIYDEEDVSDRDLASALLTQWAAKVRRMAELAIFSQRCA